MLVPIIPHFAKILLCLSLSFRGNAILDKTALQSLIHVSNTLRALVISENPVVDAADYRVNVLILLPQLERLDKEHVSPEERAEAQDMIKVKISKLIFVTGQTATALCLRLC